MDGNGIPSAWLRGLVDFCLLALLAEGEAYGYELMRRLEAHGIGPVPGGSLYPALLRLENQGHLVSEWRAGDGGPGRKYYVLTERGTAALAQDLGSWQSLSAAIDSLLRRAQGVTAR